MMDLLKLRRTSAKIANGLVLMIVGAWLLTRYLDFRYPWLEPTLRGIDNFLFGAYLACLLGGTFLRPKEEQSDIREPSPRWSGTFVVLATGGTAALAVATIGPATGEYWGAAIIVVGTLIAAIIVWGFATRHAGEIGEARFTE